MPAHMMMPMRTQSFAAAMMGSLLIGSLLTATALTPVRAADMTFERALNAAKEPQNWLLHHGNYQGHRFSPLMEIKVSPMSVCAHIQAPRQSMIVAPS